MIAILAGRRLSAGSRVALALTTAVVIGVALVAGLSFVLFSRQLARERDLTLQREAQAFAALITSSAGEETEDIALEATRYLSARDPGVGPVLVVQQAGKAPMAAPSSTPLAVDERNLRLLDSAQAKRFVGPVQAGGEKFQVTVVPVVDSVSGRTVAVVEAALAIAPLQHTAAGLLRALVIAGLVVALIGVLLSRQVARGALRPLHQAAQAAGEINPSSLSRRVPYDGPADDVGLLVASLNRMLDRLDKAFAEQRRFVADASHELRTPITVVRGHLDVMRAEGGLTQDQEDTIALASDELQRMGSLVGDLLSLARLEGGGPPRFEPIDLGEVVEEAVVLGQGLGARRFSFNHGGPLPVRGSRDLLLQALLNLLSNAVRYTRENGRIAVACGRRGNHAWVTVGDDGVGIPEADLERIFDRFYRGSFRTRPQDGGGSGLGLAIARRLVELHGGGLVARNGPRGGAEFELDLPLVEGHEETLIDI